MRNSLWYEFVQAKFGEIYLAHYLNKQKLIRKWFKILTLVLSTGGIFGWTIWDGFPLIACVLISSMQIINLLENQIIISDKNLDDTCELRDMYIRYSNSLEKLWTEFKSDEINEQQAKDCFFEYRKMWEKIETLDNKLDIKKWKPIILKADLEARNYINQYHS